MPGIGTELVGLEVLHSLSRHTDDAWAGGRIYDPTSGNTYTCLVTVEGEGHLGLRGYLGIPLIGRTTTWTRFGSENQRCRDVQR